MSFTIGIGTRLLDSALVIFLLALTIDCAGAHPPQNTASQPGPASTSPTLNGTSWQLVKFQGGDGTTLTPDDRAKYTIAFAAGDSISARIDCNRGRGSWKSNGPSQLQLGPLALTRAQCPPGSLHDQIVKQWGNVRSYVVKSGHLFLSLMADGGIYEFEPTP
jgi:para-nitrobenzyl esterase